MENNNNAAANSNVNTEVNNNPAGANAGTEKTFTQEEVNNIVQERLARERAKNEPTPAELREKELTARENKMSCKEYIAEQKYPSELLDLFDTADMEWLLFVVDNRRGVSYRETIDMHIGPVTDDNVYQSIRLFETGILNAEEAVKRLKTEVLHDQWTFHTQKALSYCRFTDYLEVK